MAEDLGPIFIMVIEGHCNVLVCYTATAIDICSEGCVEPLREEKKHFGGTYNKTILELAF
jgi:predicted nucleic acid-binding Zn ribbon protein